MTNRHMAFFRLVSCAKVQHWAPACQDENKKGPVFSGALLYFNKKLV